jgi:hypothetical protein
MQIHSLYSGAGSCGIEDQGGTILYICIASRLDFYQPDQQIVGRSKNENNKREESCFPSRVMAAVTMLQD